MSDTAIGEKTTEPGDATRTSSGRELPAEPAPIEPGQLIGRYRVVVRIGAGSMGAVYRAYDEELDREVALKLLHESAAHKERSRSRLLREAKAMAKLAHPNVIPVFDVGFVTTAAGGSDNIYVAMELVEGHDLKAWLALQPRPWRAVVDVFLQAGRGLVAAHRAGLVHRDFKPANVLVGIDGRVRVVDFGVARLGRHAVVAPDPGEPVDEAALSMAAEQLTRADGLLGTPAYIAPEHYSGAQADARSDQYAFCVSLWEGLYGQRPFVARLMPDLMAKILRGTPDDPPPGRRVPGRLRRLLARGLARDPEQRFDSMEQLLEELRRIRFRSRRLAVFGIAGAAAVGSAVGALALSRSLDLDRPAEVCTGGEQRLATVWDEPRRAAVDPAVAGRLDAYAKAWVEAYTDACEATNVRGEQSPQLLDLRVACLDGARRELGALADVLSSSPAVEDPVEATYALPPVAKCSDAERLMSTRSDEDIPAALQADFDKAVALKRAGRYEDGAALAGDVAARADTPQFKARAVLLHGELSDMLGRPAEAQSLLEDAAARAAEAGDAQTAAASLATLLYVHAVSRGDPRSALTLGPAADALARLADDDLVKASLHNNLGAAHYKTGNAEEAASHFAGAVRLRTRALGPDHPAVARSLSNEVAALRTLGRLDEATELLAKIERIVAVAYPSDHPAVADVHSLAATLHSAAGHNAEAAVLERKALAIAEEVLSPDHPKVGEPLVNVAAYELAAGRPAEALPFARRATALFDRILPADHPNRANALTMQGDCLAALDRHEEAVRLFEQALEVGSEERSLPLHRANVRLSLALSLKTLGRDPDRVRALAQAAIPAYREAGSAKWLAEAEALLKE